MCLQTIGQRGSGILDSHLASSMLLPCCLLIIIFLTDSASLRANSRLQPFSFCTQKGPRADTEKKAIQYLHTFPSRQQKSFIFLKAIGPVNATRTIPTTPSCLAPLHGSARLMIQDRSRWRQMLSLLRAICAADVGKRSLACLLRPSRSTEPGLAYTRH